MALNTHLGGLPAYAGNQVELLPDYAGSLARIAEEIEKAHYFAHIEYFIIAMDDATEACFVAMEAAAQRGVKVRVLLDQLGSSSYPHYKEMLDRMTKAGIEWHLMLPVKFFSSRFTRPDLRNHRKIVVVDGAGRLRRLTEPDRSHLSQEEEPEKRAVLHRVGGASNGASGAAVQRALHDRLVLRDR